MKGPCWEHVGGMMADYDGGAFLLDINGTKRGQALIGVLLHM
jgi:hypothetical protein